MKDTKYNKLKLLFIGVFIALCIAPFALMPWFGNQAAESDDADVSLPDLFIEGKFNKNFFLNFDGSVNTGIVSQVGDYFSKKFAFRREMVDAGDTIKAGVFGVSGQSGVVCGRKGYLFYTDSFNDYLGRNEMSDYEVSGIASNLKLMQDTLTENGVDFLFTISPNKNSLYPDLMPKRYRPNITMRNSVRLIPMLTEYGVRYQDLFGLFNSRDDVMYLKGDSHWNNEGAAMVAETLMTEVERVHYSYAGEKYTVRKDFKGDLYNMLYPARNVTDKQVYYDRMSADSFGDRVTVSMVDDMTGEMTETDISKDPEWTHSAEIKTEHEEKESGSLLMIRDSFGNSLTPFIADEFKSATFLNGTPYDLDRAFEEDRELVIFELVERNLDRLINDAPVLSTISAGLSKTDEKDAENAAPVDGKYNGTLTAEPSDSEFDYTYISGNLDPEKTGKGVRLYAKLTDKATGESMYAGLFHTRRHYDSDEEAENDPDSAYGTACYLKTADIPAGEYDLSLIYKDKDGWHDSGSLGVFNAEM